jgi:predicted nucleic acid binding AN1-type Zn finger protein
LISYLRCQQFKSKSLNQNQLFESFDCVKCSQMWVDSSIDEGLNSQSMKSIPSVTLRVRFPVQASCDQSSSRICCFHSFTSSFFHSVIRSLFHSLSLWLVHSFTLSFS